MTTHQLLTGGLLTAEIDDVEAFPLIESTRGPAQAAALNVGDSPAGAPLVVPAPRQAGRHRAASVLGSTSWRQKGAPGRHRARTSPWLTAATGTAGATISLTGIASSSTASTSIASSSTASTSSRSAGGGSTRMAASGAGSQASSYARVAVLLAAHNEQAVIAATLQAAAAQTYPVQTVLVMADNCTDETAQIARGVDGVTVVETVGNMHRKSGALNAAYHMLRGQVDFIACIDADTVLPPESIEQWVEQMLAEPATGGISARFTMQPDPANTWMQNVWARLQKAEFARWTDTALNRGGHTSVLAGTACMLRMSALEAVHDERMTEGVTDGPWSYTSQVEDFELTYRLRRLGWSTKVSYSVRAYTDAMINARALWAQRMKWQCGTVEDLLTFGINRLTLRDWGQQFLGLCAAAVRFGWLATTAAYAAIGMIHVDLIWFLLPLLFVLTDVKHAMRVPHRDRKDLLLAALLLPQEAFAWMRAGWFTRAWTACLWSRATGRRKDRWALQYAAEAAR